MTHEVVVDAERAIGRIHPEVYGHFVEHLGHCIYDGIWVGEDSPIANERGIRRDVVGALRGVRPPVIRWPGGCFADDYHWRDGVGPRAERPRRVNAHWGGVVETNRFGTQEFMDLCRQVGARPYVCGNVGSGSPAEMRDWLEYMNFAGDSTLAALRARNGHAGPFGVTMFGVGNENWGCGGNMTPEQYAGEVRRFATYLHDFGAGGLRRIACGPSGDDPSWTRGFFEALAGLPDGPSKLGLIQGFGLHYYCGTAGTATEYTDDQWYELLERALRVEGVVARHRAMMDEFDPDRRIGLVVDEWGAWHPVTPGTHPRFLRQQNTVRDGLVAALTLDAFNRQADKVVMANIAQTVNVLQALVLTEAERMLTTPTYHVYAMYAPHQGAESLATEVATDRIGFGLPGGGRGSVPRLAGSCSRTAGGLTLSLVNTHAGEPAEVAVRLGRGGAPRPASWRVLTAEDIHAHNTFDEPARVVPVDAEPTAPTLRLPPASINVLTYV